MLKQLPFLTYEENGKSKPVFLSIAEMSPDNPFHKNFYHSSKDKTISGYFVPELKRKKNDGEPLTPEDIEFFRELKSWLPHEIRFDEEEYKAYIKSMGISSQEHSKILNGKYNKVVTEYMKEGKGKLVMGYKAGNGIDIDGGGIFEDMKIIFSRDENIYAHVYMRKEFDEQGDWVIKSILPVHEEGDEVLCLLLDPPEFSEIFRRLNSVLV